MSKYNVIWIDDKIDSIKERHSAWEEYLGPNIEITFFQYFDQAKVYYDNNFKNIYGIILDYKAMENERDTMEKGRVGATMLRTFLKKCHQNDQMIPICFATAVPDDISKDQIDMYKQEYKHEGIAVFDKEPNPIEMFEWMKKNVGRVEMLSSNKYIAILEKYLSEGSKNSIVSFSNMKRRTLNQEERISGGDFSAFGKYTESLLKQMPIYTNMPSEIDGKQWGQMKFSDQVYHLSNTQDRTKEKIQYGGRWKYPYTDHYLNCNKYNIPFNPIIHQFLDLVRYVKNKAGSHETTTNNPYTYSMKQYKVVFDAFKQLLIWFDHIYKDKYEEENR